MVESDDETGGKKGSEDDSDEDEKPNENEAKDIIESFLDLENVQITWKMIEYLSKDPMTHLLMSYISQMPLGPKFWDDIKEIDYEKPIPGMPPLHSEDEEIVKATKLYVF